VKKHSLSMKIGLGNVGTLFDSLFWCPHHEVQSSIPTNPKRITILSKLWIYTWNPKQHVKAQLKNFSCEDVTMMNVGLVIEQGKLMGG
jgi:hypothetical protein